MDNISVKGASISEEFGIYSLTKLPTPINESFHFEVAERLGSPQWAIFGLSGISRCTNKVPQIRERSFSETTFISRNCEAVNG